MNLEHLANIGEFLGGLAVVVTLIYLAVQFRANLNANRAQAIATWTTAAQAEKEAIFSDQNFARIYRQIVIEGKPPEGDDAVQFYAQRIQLMNSWQLAFLQSRLGVIPPKFLEKISTGYVRGISDQHSLNWWKASGSSMYDDEFVAHVNNLLPEDA